MYLSPWLYDEISKYFELPKWVVRYNLFKRNDKK